MANNSDRLTEKVNVLSWDCGLSNLCYCLIEYVNQPEKEFEIRLWENFSLHEHDLKEAIVALVRELDKRPWMLQADHICIEEQLDINPTMRIMSHAIQTYFVTKSKIQEASSHGVSVVRRSGPRIAFISAQMKFKVCSVPDPTENGESAYKKNKKIAIAMAKKVLQNQRDYKSLAYLESFKKKDDLADSLLQGIIFMRELKKKNDINRSIQKHLGCEITINDEEVEKERQSFKPYVYRSENYQFPIFDVEGTSVSMSEVFRKNKD